MGYKFIVTAMLCRDRQEELPLGLCPECHGEIYSGDIYIDSGAALYHKDCLERMMEHGDRGCMPPCEG